MSENTEKATSSGKTSLEKSALSLQYGGLHSGTWVEHLPESVIPYIQLARLSPPTAVFLIYFPHLFGVLHSALVHRHPWWRVAITSLKLLGGSLFFSNAAHAWNDIIDAPIDRLVARSKNRPIARGAISSRSALAFAISQAVAAATFLFWLPADAVLATVPTIVGTTYYPWSKRHTYFPHVVLGFCLAWGVIVGSAALGTLNPWKDRGALCLVIITTFWTVIYDTIYACQDIKDDLLIGVKSTPVLFGQRTKNVLWVVVALEGAALVAYGWLVRLGVDYYVIAVLGSLLSLIVMVSRVKLEDQMSCWWWFSRGFWFVGVAITSGLLTEYILRY
ncbi:prenyltransferase [Xylaria nigripes]|nr:prenyltransferase [Xylaria nigripes]